METVLLFFILLQQNKWQKSEKWKEACAKHLKKEKKNWNKIDVFMIVFRVNNLKKKTRYMLVK